MIWTIIIILLVLWGLGSGLGGADLGGLIHILLVAAVVLILIVDFARGRRI